MKRSLYCGRTPETRAGDKPMITGYAAVFYNPDDPGTEYPIWGGVERIMPGAFSRAIREDDVRSLFNHDENIVLGRLRSGTLRLSEDDIGLRYEIDPPETQLVRDQVVSPIERGDVSGSSFMFTVPAGGAIWVDEERGEEKIQVRQITEVNLWETGPVTFPAYESSTSEARSAVDAESRQRARNRQRDRDRVIVAARIAELDLSR